MIQQEANEDEKLAELTRAAGVALTNWRETRIAYLKAQSLLREVGRDLDLARQRFVLAGERKRSAGEELATYVKKAGGGA